MSIKSKKENDLATGHVGELLSAAELMRRGWIVSFPFAPCPFDALATKGGHSVRLQVKSGEPYIEKGRSSTRYRFKTHRNNSGPYADNDFDFWIFVALEHHVFFVIPFAEILPIFPQWRPAKRGDPMDAWRNRFELLEKCDEKCDAIA